MSEAAPSNHARMIIAWSGPAGYSAAIYGAQAMLQPWLIAGFECGGQLMISTEAFGGLPEAAHIVGSSAPFQHWRCSRAARQWQ